MRVNRPRLLLLALALAGAGALSGACLLGDAETPAVGDAEYKRVAFGMTEREVAGIVGTGAPSWRRTGSEVELAAFDARGATAKDRGAIARMLEVKVIDPPRQAPKRGYRSRFYDGAEHLLIVDYADGGGAQSKWLYRYRRREPLWGERLRDWLTPRR